MPPSRRVTIADIAARVGLTSITVSRALNRPDMVKAETRAKIEAAAHELGYVPNAFARGLKHNQSRLIGLVIASIDNPFYAEMIKAISRQAKQYNYTTLLFDTDGEPWLEANAIEALISYQAAGIILSPVSDEPSYQPAYLKQLQRSRVPVVQLDRALYDTGFSSVTLDNKWAGQCAANYLLDQVFTQGHADTGSDDHLLIVAGPQQSHISRQRLAGMREKFESRQPSIEINVLWGDYTLESAQEAVGEFLDCHTPPRALFGFNQLIMLGSLKALKSRGIAWHSVELVGIDRLPYIDTFDIKVPCVVHDGHLAGEQALALLMAHIREPQQPAQTVTIKGSLIQ